MATLQDLIDVIQDLIDQGVDVRFIKDSVAHDINISQDSSGLYRFHTKESSEINVLELSVSGLAINDVDYLYQNASFLDDGWIYGFNISGDTDGYYVLSVNGVEVARDNTEATRNSINFMLPKPFPVSVGDSIELTVLNRGVQVGSYKGSLFWEEKT